MRIYILQTCFSDYDAYEVEIKGVTSDPAQAEAWRYARCFKQSDSHYHDEVIEQELDSIDPDVLKTIVEFQASPFCECGHRKAHHKKGPKNTRCEHNHKDAYKIQDTEDGPWIEVPPHQCKQFVEKQTIAIPCVWCDEGKSRIGDIGRGRWIHILNGDDEVICTRKP